jgi:hypothetical protein
MNGGTTITSPGNNINYPQSFSLISSNHSYGYFTNTYYDTRGTNCYKEFVGYFGFYPPIYTNVSINIMGAYIYETGVFDGKNF